LSTNRTGFGTRALEYPFRTDEDLPKSVAVGGSSLVSISSSLLARVTGRVKYDCRAVETEESEAYTLPVPFPFPFASSSARLAGTGLDRSLTKLAGVLSVMMSGLLGPRASSLYLLVFFIHNV